MERVADDFTVRVIECFCDLTGRMVPSPADYDQAMEWETMGMPIEVVLQALRDDIGRNAKKKWLPHMKLEWANAAVQDAYRNWRRGFGPQYGSVS